MSRSKQTTVSSLNIVSPEKSLDSGLRKQKIPEREIERFCENFDIYIQKIQQYQNPREEFKLSLIDFLRDTWYNKNEYEVCSNIEKNDTRIDLGIFKKSDSKKPVVFFETKRPDASDMFRPDRPNCKALQECVYYFMQESLLKHNDRILHIIITNYTDLYIFKAKDFQEFFIKGLSDAVKTCREFVEHPENFTSSNTADFYEKYAAPAIDEWIQTKQFAVTHVDFTEYQSSKNRQSRQKLEALYQILSPEYLLNKPIANDNNALNENFYNELLHIIGLEEVKDGKKKLIQRKTKRSRTSLIESAMNRLDISDEKERFEKALNLSMTWVNRLLFLKLVEALLVSYHKNEADKNKYKFLTTDTLVDFNGLNDLFFLVLGKKPHERTEEYKEKYKHVPYLNSSLFELSEEENKYHIKISEVDFGPLEIYKKTVLRDEKGKVLTGTKNNLKYMLEFLDAYNFSNDSDDGVASDTNRLINASVLGLIFEKINGYKDGSYFTPAFITEYMAKEAIERAVVQKFNDVKGWNCSTLDELAEKIDDRTEANRIINSITICDPAVGSGHFLVSVLNRLLYIKSYLNILQDFDGKRIKKSDWELRLEHDDISVFDGEGQRFFYSAKNDERQRIQKAIFHEKKTIIENCLFGVDINPTSVYVCRLRLWIELLKNAYYTDETRGSENPQLETLPNIDINIKCGNSLVSKYPVELKKSVLSEDKSTQKIIDEYKKTVRQYKNESNKSKKSEVKQRIQQIKATIHSSAQLYLFDKEANKKILSEDIYKNSIEWMFEFPEVLDKSGKFLGFDVVIGNPPYFNIETLGAKSSYAEFVKKNFSEIWQDKSDILFYFFHLALKLTQNKICFITSNAYLFSDKAQKLRRKMILDSRLRKIVNFEEFMVFPDASITTCITLMSNESRPFCAINVNGKKWKQSELLAYIENPKNVLNVTLAADSVFALVDSKIDALNIKIDGRHKKLRELFKTGSGMQTAANSVFCFSEYPSQFPSEFIKRRMCGEIITRYHIAEKNEYILYLEDVSDFQKLPKSIQEHLNAHKNELSNRAQIKRSKTSAWWKYTFAMHKEYYHLNKIWCSYRSRTNEFVLDESTDFIGLTNTTVIFDTNKNLSLKYLIALLNSKLLTFRYKSIGKQTGSGVYEYFENGVGKLPVPDANSAQQQPIIDLVDKILNAKKADPNSETSAWEREIDKLVYALYGLTEEEIAVVENASERTKKE